MKVVKAKFLWQKIDLSSYAKLAISTTVSNFQTLINTSALVPNQWYLITDYRTVDYIRQSNTPVYQWHIGDVEQIYVLALDVNEVCPEGWSKDFPDEKIIYKPSRTIFSENPDWSLDNAKVNSGSVEVSTPSATIMEFTNNPFSVSPKDWKNFIMNISDGSNFNYDYDANNYWVDWQFDGNWDFELLKTYYDVPVYRYIDWQWGVNQGSQEITLLNETTFEATTPLTDFNTIDPDNYYYFYILDNDTGAENYYDYIDRDWSWKINASGQFELLDSGTYTSNYAYYEEWVGNSWDIDLTIQGSNEFSLDRLDWNLRKGSDQTGNTWFSIAWSDSTATDLYVANYGVDWEISGNSVFLLGNSHDLTTDLIYIEGWPMGTDQNTLIDLGDDVSIYSDFYTLGLDVDLTGFYYLNGSYSYEVAGSDSGLIIGRQIPEIDLEIDVDYRATKFRRYQNNAATYSGATTYAQWDIVLYNSETYICLTGGLNKTPSTQNLYWIKMTSNEWDAIHNKYLGKWTITLSTLNPYNTGLVTQATLVAGGTGYPASSTFNARVLAGDAQCTISVSTDGSGVVTTINSVVTTGRGYFQNNSSYPYYCSSTGDWWGLAVQISTTDTIVSSYVTPNLASYTDFDLFPDVTNIRTNFGLKIRNNSVTPMDLVLKSDTNINSTLTTNGGTATLRNVNNTNASLNGNVMVISSFNNSDILYIESSIAYILNSTKSKLINGCSLYRFEYSNIDAIIGTFTGSYKISYTTGLNWTNAVIQSSINNTFNYLSQFLMVAQNASANFINKAEYVTFPWAFSITQNNVTGYIKKIYANAFFKSNVISSDCWYLSVTGSYFESNVLNCLIGVETTWGNSIHPCVFDVFTNNEITGVLMNIAGKLAFSNNTLKSGMRSATCYREDGSTFQISWNNLWNSAINFYIYQNNGSFSNNIISGAVSNITYQYLAGASKTFTDNSVSGRLMNLIMIKWNATYNVFYGLIGTGTANTVNSNTSSTLTNCVFFGGVNGNLFSGQTSSSVFNYTCQNNVFSTVIENSVFEQNFIGNTFTGNIYRVTFTKQVNSLVIPALADVIFPTMVIRGKDDGASTQIFLIENASAVDILRITGNDKIETNGITGNSSFNFGKSISYPYLAATSNTTLGQNDHVCNCTSWTFTVTLPSASWATRRVYIIKNSWTGVITVDAEWTQTIDGELTQTLIQWESITLMSNWTNWIIL